GNGTQWSYKYCSSITVNGTPGTESCPTIAGAVGTYVVINTPVAGPIDLAAQTTGPANGPVSKTYYDSLGRAIRTETQCHDGTSTRTCYQDTEYYSLGQVSRTSRPYFSGATSYWVSYSYDLLGRVIQATN